MIKKNLFSLILLGLSAGHVLAQTVVGTGFGTAASGSPTLGPANISANVQANPSEDTAACTILRAESNRPHAIVVLAEAVSSEVDPTIKGVSIGAQIKGMFPNENWGSLSQDTQKFISSHLRLPNNPSDAATAFFVGADTIVPICVYVSTTAGAGVVNVQINDITALDGTSVNIKTQTTLLKLDQNGNPYWLVKNKAIK